MKQQLLLLNDVDALGKKGEVVSAKPGYVRNFLLPKRLAVVATPNMLRKQERLRSERAERAVVDRKESEELASQIETISLEIKVKVDPEGHMYGSVSAADIAHLFVERGLPVEKRNVAVTRPIKETGSHKIVIKLKEGITVHCQLNIIPEGIIAGAEKVVKAIPVEGAPAESAEAPSPEETK
jgi:large subunit ribosomal protein L9